MTEVLDHNQPESIFDTPDWQAALALNAIMIQMAPGLDDETLDAVDIRNFPPVRHLRVPPMGRGISTHFKRANAEERMRRRKVAENFLSLGDG